MANSKVIFYGETLIDLTQDTVEADALLAGYTAHDKNGETITGTLALNFSVVGGEAQPASPRENTIWVNTSADITGWVFSVTEPTSPTDGMVWFTTGASSITSFNAVKKNGLWVYPTGCQQYVSGTWVTKVAKTYQNGTWVDWSLYLYNNGDEVTSVTGGWEAIALKLTASTGSFVPNITRNADNLYITGQSTTYAAGAVKTKNKISLANYNTLKAEILNASSYANEYMKLGLYTAVGATEGNNRVAGASISSDTNNRQTLTIDVSNLNDDYYVMFTGLYTQNAGQISKLYVYEVRVE